MQRTVRFLAFLLVLTVAAAGARLASADTGQMVSQAGHPHAHAPAHPHAHAHAPARPGNVSPRHVHVHGRKYWVRVPHYYRHAPSWRYHGYYPQYYGGFHARYFQDIGTPTGDIPSRGRAW